MKFIHLTFLLLLVAGFTSCDDDENDMMNPGLVGDWTALSLDASIDATLTSPTVNTSSNTELSGTAFDYDLNFSETQFTAGGTYDISTTTTANGTTTTTDNSYTGVSNTGPYTATGSQITFNGNLFELEFNGMPFMGSGGPQTVDYSINGDLLTITQNETIDTIIGDLTSSSSIQSTSTWRRN